MLHRFAMPETSAVFPESSAMLLAGFVETLVDGIPADDVPPRAEIVGSSVLVLQVVRMLPDVVAEDGRCAVGHGVVLVRRRRDLKLAAGAADEPDPAAAELLGARLVERFLE